MDLVNILPDVGYPSEVLCCTILTYIMTIVKVTHFEILCEVLLKVFKVLEVYMFWSTILEVKVTDLEILC